MIRLFAQMIVVVVLPVAAFVLGGWLMSQVVDREYLLNRLSTDSAADSKPLGQRLAYDADAVRRHWAALDPRGREVARQLLEIDLVYPCLYGGALIFSLAIGWWILGRPLNFFWVAAPVLVTMFADWCENLVQLSQLGRYERIGPGALEPQWIRIASVATTLKLSFVAISGLLLLILVIIVLIRGFTGTTSN